MKLVARALLVMVGLAGCGDQATSAPDAAPPDGAIADIVPECHVQTFAGAPFMTSADFGPRTPGTLAGWEPDGRWFLTGVSLGDTSSFHLAQQGGDVIVDHDADHPAPRSPDELFVRTSQTINGAAYLVVKRISDRHADGSLKAQRALCMGNECTVCTARMIRATHNGDEAESDGLSFVGQYLNPSWTGYTFNVRVMGTLAYLIRIDGLHIIETADPAHPVELGHYRRNGPGYSNDVKLVEANGHRYALIADYPVDIVDVTDPAAPVLVSHIAEEAHTLFTEARGGKLYAYMGNYDASCPVFDITNPAAPMRLGRFRTTAQVVHDLSVENGIAYLNAWDHGMYVVDFTDPTAPHEIGHWAATPTGTSHSNWTTTVAGRHIAIHGEEAYGAHLDVVDVDPASPTFMQPFASYKTRDWISIHNIMAFGDRAYLTHYQDGVRIIDLSNPTAPHLAAYFNTWDPQSPTSTSAFFEGAVGLDVDLARKLIFVADSPRGLLILHDDTTP